MAKASQINLRVKQDLAKDWVNANVTVVAPNWVKKALKQLEPKLQGATFTVNAKEPFSFKISGEITLAQLVMIARNEAYNTTGNIDFDLYEGIEPSTVIALRDLVKHCVIVGKDTANQYGGYPNPKSVKDHVQPVYICDLPGLQFQQPFNNGRLVLIHQQNEAYTSLERTIFKETVGEDKASLASAKDFRRYQAAKFCGKKVLFDTHAFHQFVAQDYLLAFKALNNAAKVNQDELTFRFLKYGTGFFAESLKGPIKKDLSVHVAVGVLKGLESAVKLPLAQRSQIKRIELPFFEDTSNPNLVRVLKEIKDLCHKHGLEFSCKPIDALAPSDKYMVATTNCSDPHAPTGNEMNHQSVDAAIAENLVSKGNIFNPVCNPQCKSSYMPVKHRASRLYTILVNNSNESLAFLGGVGLGSSFSHVLFGLSRLASAGVGTAIGLASSLVLYIRQQYMDDYYIEFKTEKRTIKTEEELNAFKTGQKASKSLLVQAKSWFSRDCLNNCGAFYAGMMKEQLGDDKLKAKLPKKK